VWHGYVRLIDKRANRAGDEVPVFAELNGNDWLELEDDIAIAAERTDIEIGDWETFESGLCVSCFCCCGTS
jgi:hypothetical protein